MSPISPTSQPITGTPSDYPLPIFQRTIPTTSPSVTPPCKGGAMLLTPSLFGLHDGTISGLSENCCAIAALTRKNLSNPLTVNCASTFVGQLTKVRDSQSCPINTNISIVDTSGEVSVLNNSILGRIYFVNPTLCKFPTLTFLHPLINMAEFNQNGQQIDWTLSGAFGTRAYFPRLDSKHGARIKVTSKGSKSRCC